MSFTTLGLSELTLKAVAEVGYTEPTSIQEQAIPPILEGRDVVGIAQTGTGKTAGFTLPMIDILASGRAKARMPRSLILAPTRELATQIGENFVKYGKYHKLSMALLIGGESLPEQKRVLNHGVDVLIATPGRMMDLFDRGLVIMNDIKVLVIDEADRMLDMGFIPDVKKIISWIRCRHQTLLFSATMDKEIKELAEQFMTFPKEIFVTPPASAASTIKHTLIYTHEPAEKRQILRDLLAGEDVQNAMIFCNKKKDVEILLSFLKKYKLSVSALHGDMSQYARSDTIEAFKSGEVKFLVCSDVAARGLDLPDVSHVFNYDAPFKSEDYIHRIGRTGRAGKEGKAFTLVTDFDFKILDAIEELLQTAIPLSMDFGCPADFESSRQESRKNKYKISKQNPNKKKPPAAKIKVSETPKPPAQSPEKSKNKDNHKKPKDKPKKTQEKAFGDYTPAFLKIKI